MKGSPVLRRAWILGGLLVLLAAVGSVAWATTSAGDKIYVACAKKKGGALRLVSAARDCRKTERAVTWNQEGPRGLPGQRGLPGEDGLNGEDGIDGEDGLDGEDGDDGLDGLNGTDATVTWKYVVTSGVSVPSGTSTVPAGTCVAPTPNAANGGVQIAGLPATVRVTATARGTTASQWDVQLANTSVDPQSVSTWVLCTNGTVLP